MAKQIYEVMVIWRNYNRKWCHNAIEIQYSTHNQMYILTCTYIAFTRFDITTWHFKQLIFFVESVGKYWFIKNSIKILYHFAHTYLSSILIYAVNISFELLVAHE